MSDDHDPLVHGPAGAGPDALSWGVESARGERLPDPETGSFLSDARDLLRRPRPFFTTLGARPEVSTALFTRALLGYFLFAWLGGFFSAQRWLVHGLEIWAHVAARLAASEGSRPILVSLGLPTDEAALRAKLLGLSVLSAHFQIIVGPLVHGLALAVSALTARLLLPIFGVERTRVSYRAILTALLYVGWFSALQMLPWVGDYFSAVTLFFLSIAAVKWMYGTTGFRSFVALKFLNILVALGAMALAAGVVIFALAK